MRFYHYILFLVLFLFVSVVCRVYYLFFRKPKGPKPIKNPIKEGFESLTNCLDQGYPDDFCLRAPFEACVTNCPVGTFKSKTFSTFSS